jgi:predicted MFS family arabinose efflux permease
MKPASHPTDRMNPAELRASLSLASVQSLRMLGLFMVLPVLAVHARSMEEGGDPALLGLALGIYGLTQAMLQLPFGIASDRFGRKPVIIFGLLVFAVGSLVAALATDLTMMIIGRGLQGAGAISAAVSALVADSTRDSQRTKAMALVGISIGAMFALSLIVAPPLYRWLGIAGMFTATAVFAAAAILWVIYVVPDAPQRPRVPLTRAQFGRVASDPELARINLGIFSLHAVQVAMFVVLPGWLVERAGLAIADHWMFYLPVVLLSFAPMMPAVGWGERSGRAKEVFIASVAVLVAVLVGLALKPEGVVLFAVLLFVFFSAFNILEASLPSMASRRAPAEVRGAALGLFNTTQSLGLFVGGAAAGLVRSTWGDAAVFVAAASLLGAWLLAALWHRRLPDPAH